MSVLDRPLSELAAASEELLQLLRRRDPQYLEALERRQRLLEQIRQLCREGGAPPSARAALERVRQLGEACEQEARAMRREAAEALAGLGAHEQMAASLERLAAAAEPALLDVRA